MKISVIFTTYNSTAWLEKVLWGFCFQSDKDFELVVADDGSGEETRQLIEQFCIDTGMIIRHVWHEDEGFRKCRILNKAILEASGDYLILTDGDCIPRHDFVAVHRAQAEPGRFLSGGYFKLPMATSKALTKDDIQAGHCFNTAWLVKNGVKASHKFMKFTRYKWLAYFYNLLTPTKRTWNGHNASCWKSDALAVNGFDERMRYGGLDVEFGFRLVNAGIRAKQIRYLAICVHLDHARGYRNEEDLARNMEIRRKSKAGGVKETPAGITQSLS